MRQCREDPEGPNQRTSIRGPVRVPSAPAINLSRVLYIYDLPAQDMLHPPFPELRSPRRINRMPQGADSRS